MRRVIRHLQGVGKSKGSKGFVDRSRGDEVGDEGSHTHTHRLAFTIIVTIAFIETKAKAKANKKNRHFFSRSSQPY